MISSASQSHFHPPVHPSRPKKRQRTNSTTNATLKQEHDADHGSPTTSISTPGSPYHHERRISHDPNSELNPDKIVHKRACNECRQQKLRCDVIQDPYTDCSRCKKLKLECRIDPNFRRQVKRSRVAELEKEVADLKQELATKGIEKEVLELRQIAGTVPVTTTSMSLPQPELVAYNFPPGGQISQPLLDATTSAMHMFNQAQGAVAKINGIKHDPFVGANTLSSELGPGLVIPVGAQVGYAQLDDILISDAQVGELFKLYFDNFHPFLPLLSPNTSPSAYRAQSELLFWSIISVASRRYMGIPTLLLRLSKSVTKLVWQSLSGIPHSKEVVKSLILLTTWPFPMSSTMTDPTYQLSGMAISVAQQMGLHRPGYNKDYTKWANRAKVDEDEIRDNITVWACCNITGQSVSTGLGLPSHTQYDWTLCHAVGPSAKYPLTPSLRSYLLIQRFSDEVTRSMTSNSLDPIGLLSAEERRAVVSVLERRADELEGELSPLSDLHEIYMMCARLQLRSYHLFDPPSSPAYERRILSLFSTASSLVQHVLNVENKNTSVLLYCPFYVYQMFLSASFVILKVIQSPRFKDLLVDYDWSKNLFKQSISSIRRMSVAKNDLPNRMVQVLNQWSEKHQPTDDDFDLKIRSRMSMSVMYDILWKWREEFTSKSAYLQSKEEVGTAIEESGQPNTANNTPDLVPNDKANPSSHQSIFTQPPPPLPLSSTIQILDPTRQPTPLLVDLGLDMADQGQLDMNISPMHSDDLENLNWIIDERFDYYSMFDNPNSYVDLNAAFPS